jgi:hypothetical protein
MKAATPGTIRWLGALALSVSLSGPAQSMTPEQFAGLEPEQQLQTPALETVDVFGWSKQEFLFVLENALIDLRYLFRAPSGTSSNALTSAIKAFQQDIGHEANGTLSFGEFLELVQSGNEFWQAPIVPGPNFVSRHGDVVSAEGTWIAGGTAQPNPIQTTSIRCYRVANLCSMVTARVVTEVQPGGWYHSPAMDFDLQTRDWKVTRWSEEQVEAEDRSGPCLTFRLSIDLRHADVTMVSQPTGAAQCSADIAPGRTYQLGNGYDVAASYWEERRIRSHKLRSSMFQKLTERIQRKPTK